jgi:O-antigen/teichoic acid export membrane protein
MAANDDNVSRMATGGDDLAHAATGGDDLTQAAAGSDETAHATAGAPNAHRASYRSGFAFGSLSFFAMAALGVISTIVTARVYGVRVIGQWALVWAPVAALWILSSVKEQAALIKEITGLPRRHPRVTQLFAVVFMFSSGLTAVVATIDATLCWFVFHGPLHAPELIVPVFVNIAGYVLVTNTGWNIDAVFSAFVAGRELFWVRLHEVLSFIVIATAIGLAWRSVWGMVIGTIGGSLTALVHRSVALRPFVRARLDRREFRAGLRVLPELLRFGLRAAPGTIAQGVSQQGGVWALGTVAPIAVVGAYSRALTVPQRLQQASMRITAVLYPTLVGRHTRGDGEGFDRAVIDSIRYEMIGMLLIAAAVGGCARSVLGLFGPGFGRASTALALLMLFPALASITVTQTQVLWATNKPGQSSVIAMVRLVITLVLLVVLTPPLGITGPAIALLAGYVAIIVLYGVALRPSLTRPLRVTWPLRERLALLLSYVAGFAAARAVEFAIPSLPGLPLCLAAGVVVYTVAFVVCGGINARDRHRLTETLKWARARRARGSVQLAEPSEPDGTHKQTASGAPGRGEQGGSGAPDRGEQSASDAPGREALAGERA